MLFATILLFSPVFIAIMVAVIVRMFSISKEGSFFIFSAIVCGIIFACTMFYLKVDEYSLIRASQINAAKSTCARFGDVASVDQFSFVCGNGVEFDINSIKPTEEPLSEEAQ